MVVHKFRDGFKWVELISENAYNYESNQMSHCVADYYGRSRSIILSLRDRKGKPHITAEIKHNEITQVQGKGNSIPLPKYREYEIWLYDSFKTHNRILRYQGLINTNKGVQDIENLKPGTDLSKLQDLNIYEYQKYEEKVETFRFPTNSKFNNVDLGDLDDVYIGKGVKIKGNLRIMFSDVNTFKSPIWVEGNCTIQNCNVKEWPKMLFVGGDLKLGNINNFDHLPEEWNIRGYIRLKGVGDLNRIDNEEIEKRIPDKYWDKIDIL